MGEMLIAVFLRKAKQIKWLQAILSPIVVLHNDFLSFRLSSLYKVKHNSQVVYLQAVLNDTFDPIFRRIRIANAVIKEPVWFYEPQDDKPVWFYEPQDDKPVYFLEESEFAGGGVDFTVLVPRDLQPVDNSQLSALLTKMKAQIDYYKLYSKNYEIKWVNI